MCCYHHSVRKLKWRDNLNRAEKLFEASMMGDVDLLKEMKKIKSGTGGSQELPDNVEVASGEEEIADKFREVYSALYNSSGSQDGMAVLREHVQGLIGPESVAQVSKVTGQA